MAHHALYNYYTNRSRRSARNLAGSAHDESTESVAEFLSNEAKSNEDFSLEVVHSSLNVEQEQDLRGSLIERLSRGCVYSGTGNLITLKGGSSSSPMYPRGRSGGVMMCYFCVVRDEMAADEAAADDTIDEQQSYFSSDMVVCFLRQFASQDVELDLFRPELDEYCAHLAQSGVLHTFRERRNKRMSDTPLTSKMALRNWSKKCIDYLPRCVTFFGQRLHLMINAALVAQELKIIGSSEELSQDVKAFFSALSLSALHHKPVGPQDDAQNEDENHYGTVTLIFAEGGTGFSIVGDLGESTEFCRQWAQAMLAERSDAIRLKRVIHNYGLQVIQDINTLKGLLNQAETNHYALYNCHLYLAACRAPARAVLGVVQRDVSKSVRKQAKDVLAALLEFEEKSSSGTWPPKGTEEC
eukprot:m.67474 g.67474  ORF g.67474 m.67474 type:complete len:412 (+) comp11891_c0_seq1:319-1554(+)